MLTIRLGIKPSKNTLSLLTKGRRCVYSTLSSPNSRHPPHGRSPLPLGWPQPSCTLYGLSHAKRPLLWPSSGMHCTTTYSLCVSKRTLSLWTIPKLFLSGQKISLWTIPKYLLTGKLNGSKNKKHRHWLLGAFGVATFLSSLFGPVVWVAVGGTASIVCWRLFRKAQKWWTYLRPATMTANDVGQRLLKGGTAAAAAASLADSSSTHSTITDTLLSQIGTHYAVDLVRNEVVQKLQDYFEKTEKGQAMLEQMFPTDNNSHSLSWEDVSRSEVVRLTNNKHMHRVSVCFSVVKDGREGQQHPCQVMASAIISDEGKMDLEEVKLSSPEWNEDEIIPLSSLK